jgi:hypothetical protein
MFYSFLVTNIQSTQKRTAGKGTACALPCKGKKGKAEGIQGGGGEV